jgi:hypothetical protein
MVLLCLLWMVLSVQARELLGADEVVQGLRSIVIRSSVEVECLSS